MITPKKANRATQTLFRTLSKNNYVLEEMIDRKAKIIITTNAIIMSILLGSSLCQELSTMVHPGLLVMLLGIWITSIMFALYAIKPFLISPKQLKWKEHNLLTYHEVKDSDIESFKSKIAKTISAEENIYNAMAEDIFQVGKNIKKKHHYLDVAAYTFILGILSSAIMYASSII